MHRLMIGTALVLVTACSTVENESFSTMIIDGRPYEIRTRTMSGAQGTFVTHSIRTDNGRYQQCDPSSPNSCRGALIQNRQHNRD